MSGDGTFHPDLPAMRKAAEALHDLAEFPKKMHEEFVTHAAAYDGWNGQPGSEDTDQFYEQTQPEWQKAKKQPIGLLTSFEQVFPAAAAAVLETVNSIQGAKGFADDIINDAKSKTKVHGNPDGYDSGDDSGYDSGYDSGDEHTGGGKH
ncbi:hypothetical protein ACFXPQ_23880 [Streptomyces lydicus]|uniref:hypothetical protein n=1 Tax=Streptomyces lydicus TaxID=47763 RepID=UPI0036AB02D0